MFRYVTDAEAAAEKTKRENDLKAAAESRRAAAAPVPDPTQQPAAAPAATSPAPTTPAAKSTDPKSGDAKPSPPVPN